MVSASKKLMENPENSEREVFFVNSLKEILACLRNIQIILGTAVELASDVDEDDLRPTKTSTPLQSSEPLQKSTFQERWMRRNMRQAEDRMSPYGPSTPSWSDKVIFVVVVFCLFVCFCLPVSILESNLMSLAILGKSKL